MGSIADILNRDSTRTNPAQNAPASSLWIRSGAPLPESLRPLEGLDVERDTSPWQSVHGRPGHCRHCPRLVSQSINLMMGQQAVEPPTRASGPPNDVNFRFGEPHDRGRIREDPSAPISYPSRTRSVPRAETQSGGTYSLRNSFVGAPVGTTVPTVGTRSNSFDSLLGSSYLHRPVSMAGTQSSGSDSPENLFMGAPVGVSNRPPTPWERTTGYHAGRTHFHHPYPPNNPEPLPSAYRNRDETLCPHCPGRYSARNFPEHVMAHAIDDPTKGATLADDRRCGRCASQDRTCRVFRDPSANGGSNRCSRCVRFKERCTFTEYGRGRDLDVHPALLSDKDYKKPGTAE